jgi:hypothetical protein
MKYILPAIAPLLRCLLFFTVVVSFPDHLLAQSKVPLKGSIQNAAGEQLSGVTVTATQGEQVVTAVADDKGNFSLDLDVNGNIN